VTFQEIVQRLARAAAGGDRPLVREFEERKASAPEETPEPVEGGIQVIIRQYKPEEEE
jgi:hypothetical protein